MVLGAALLFQSSGLSMAMGAFLAGVLLSTSTFRHQLEADVEPFRGLLLGLFFLAVGMSLDLSVVVENWGIIVLSVVGYVLVKGAAIYAIARMLKSDHREAAHRAVMMAQGGEFAFVLYTTAATAGRDRGRKQCHLHGDGHHLDGADAVPRHPHEPADAAAASSRWMGSRWHTILPSVLVIGFGRFGQIVSQPLLSAATASRSSTTIRR